MRELIQGRRAYESISKVDLSDEEISISTLIWEEDGVYVSKCMEIEFSSCGDTPKEALENLREAIDLWMKNAELLRLINCRDRCFTKYIRYSDCR